MVRNRYFKKCVEFIKAVQSFENSIKLYRRNKTEQPNGFFTPEIQRMQL